MMPGGRTILLSIDYLAANDTDSLSSRNFKSQPKNERPMFP
jgi:hypothetical protein